MRITVDSTAAIVPVEIAGNRVPARRWEGATDSGENLEKCTPRLARMSEQPAAALRAAPRRSATRRIATQRIDKENLEKCTPRLARMSEQPAASLRRAAHRTALQRNATQRIASTRRTWKCSLRSPR